MTKKLFSGILPKVIASILVIFCIAALADKIHRDNNPFFSHERITLFLSRESIMKSDQILYQDARISVTPALSDILDVPNWTKVSRVKQQEDVPILAIEYTDFQIIYIYGSYACLVDNDGLISNERAYFTFPSDISQELLAYLETCAVMPPYTP